VAAAIVGWAVLGSAERVRYVEVLGGPTRESPTLALLVRALDQLEDGRRVPVPDLPLRVLAQGGSASAAASGVTDATGLLEIRLDFGQTPTENPRLRVDEALPEGARRLAEGVLALDAERWRAGARRNGGWLVGQRHGELRVRVAAESGVFAVPFTGTLVLQVLAPRGEGLDAGGGGTSDAPADAAAGVPLSGALVHVELDGAERVAATGSDAAATEAATAPPPTAARLLPTDGAGQTRVGVRPLEHAVSARVLARAGERSGEWYGVLPVIPGAIVAIRSKGAIVVRSPIARQLGFLSVVSVRERIAGALVPLAIAADGSASGRFELDPALEARLDAEATWAVVSSESDKRSPGVVGWPLSAAFDGPAPLTFDVPDQLLLDGRSGALYDSQRRWRRWRGLAAAGLLGVAALFGPAFWSEVRRGRPRWGASGPGSADTALPIGRDGWLLAIAIGSIALGFGALAYFGWLAP
jgi:hypothetical protein